MRACDEPLTTEEIEALDHTFYGLTWAKNPDGSWKLPAWTLGWRIAGWCAEYLRNDKGGPWKFTREQLWFVLWWYAVDEYGEFIYRTGVLQRMKGWGKDPLLAVLCLVELAGAVIVHADRLTLEAKDPHTVRKWQATADLNAFMKGTGARISEAREMFWEEVDLRTGWTIIYGTKTGGSIRAVKMPQWLLLRLRKRGAMTGTEGRVFPSRHQVRDPYVPWDQSNCNKAIRKVLDGAKMRWAVPHTWRRTVATRLKNAKWDPAKAADQLGHVDPSMTMDMARADPGAADLL